MFIIICVSCTIAFSHILAPATPWGKNFMPRVAAKLDVAVIGDVMDIKSDSKFIRPAYAGNAIQVRSWHRVTYDNGNVLSLLNNVL